MKEYPEIRFSFGMLSGVKFAVTHYLDALTDCHVADLTDRPDSAFSREVFQDLWLAVFGPLDTLVTDGGPEFQGSVGVMLELLGIVQEVVPEGAKWRLGQAERCRVEVVADVDGEGHGSPRAQGHEARLIGGCVGEEPKPSPGLLQQRILFIGWTRTTP